MSFCRNQESNCFFVQQLNMRSGHNKHVYCSIPQIHSLTSISYSNLISRVHHVIVVQSEHQNIGFPVQAHRFTHLNRRRRRSSWSPCPWPHCGVQTPWVERAEPATSQVHGRSGRVKIAQSVLDMKRASTIHPTKGSRDKWVSKIL